jgi:hypothetical protein
MATTAIGDRAYAVREVIDQTGRHGPMSRGSPLFMIGTMKCRGFGWNGFSVMAFATHASTQRGGRPIDWIERVGGVISGWAVATLTLNTGKVGRCALTHKSGRQLVPNRMAGEATGFLVRMDGPERFKRARMWRIPHFVVNFAVAFRAGCSANVLPRRRRAPG